LRSLKYPSVIILVGFSFWASAQKLSEETKVLEALRIQGGFPLTLTATRSVVFYDQTLAEPELQTIQKAFQQTGIDAVAYLETARSMAGMDCKRATLKYLIKRDIKFLIFPEKLNNQYTFKFAFFDSKIDFINPQKAFWKVQDASLNNVLKTIYQEAIATEKKQNLLINDLPEYVNSNDISPITGRRNETLATDLGYFAVAFPKWGDEAADKELEIFLKENYTGKYELVESDADEADLRKRGFLFVLRYLHTYGSLAKELLGYPMARSESAIASSTFLNGELQLKTIASKEEVYKFYLKKLETGEVFLGKWDADIKWRDALKNHIDSYKAEKKLR
jgi:hypothetical protein